MTPFFICWLCSALNVSRKSCAVSVSSPSDYKISSSFCARETQLGKKGISTVAQACLQVLLSAHMARPKVM